MKRRRWGRGGEGDGVWLGGLIIERILLRVLERVIVCPKTVMSGRKWLSIEFSICSANLLDSSSHCGSGGTDKYSMSDKKWSVSGSSLVVGVGVALGFLFSLRFLVDKRGFVFEGRTGMVLLVRFLSVKLVIVDVVVGDLVFLVFLVCTGMVVCD